MAGRVFLAAGVLSLILVGTWEKAWAESPVGSDPNPGYLTVFGKTLCAADAPLVVACDWRMPNVNRLRDEVATSPTPATTAPTESPGVFRLLGMNLCFGDVPPGTTCTVQIPVAAGERHASL